MTLCSCLHMSVRNLFPVLYLSSKTSFCMSFRPHPFFLFSPSILLRFSSTNFFVVFLLCAFQVLFETSKTKERKRSMVKMKRERKAAWRPDEQRGKCMRASFSQLHSNHHKKNSQKKRFGRFCDFPLLHAHRKVKKENLEKTGKGKKTKEKHEIDEKSLWSWFLSDLTYDSNISRCLEIPTRDKKGKKENTTNQIEIIRPISSDSSISSLID